MKRALLVLTMLLMAATSFNQTSRRTVNANGSATRNTEQNNTNQRTSSRTVTNSNNNTERNVTKQDDNNTTRTYNSQDDRNTTNNNRNDNYRNNDANRNQESNYNNEHHGEEEHQSYDSRHSGNTVYVNQTSSRKYQQHHQPNHVYKHEPYNRDYRAVHYIYREPVHYDVYWTREMHRHYIEMYPDVHYWNYNIGFRINTVSAYYADYYIGEVMNVYGKVFDIYYAWETDEYFLYFGAYYPYQDFTVVLPGDIAQYYSNRPQLYFMDQYINVTGLITAFDGKPEIVVKRNFQLNIY